MREIEFRGKRIDDGEWIYGDLLQSKELEKCYIEYLDYYSDENGLQRGYCQYEVILETVGQYTGLTDKNGKKIFEGDIINSKWGKFVIIYNTRFGGFVADDDGSGRGWEFLDEIGELEVIGNIHDKPELLKGGAE